MNEDELNKLKGLVQNTCISIEAMFKKLQRENENFKVNLSESKGELKVLKTDYMQSLSTIQNLQAKNKMLTDRVEDKDVIRLTPVEIQSGSSRVKWAEGLIEQLPETHDGRNSWLINYGKREESDKIRERYNAKATATPGIEYSSTFDAFLLKPAQEKAHGE